MKPVATARGKLCWAKFVVCFLFAVYAFLNSGAFVFHTHPWQHVVSKVSVSTAVGNHDCPLCDWGQQNLATSPNFHFFSIAWEAVSNLRRHAPASPRLTPSLQKSARAPPLS